jgi:pimeloyl-ACP methyl ester carboxylesterase
MFVNSPSAELHVIPDGAHFLSASHPEKVDDALISFVGKWHKI